MKKCELFSDTNQNTDKRKGTFIVKIEYCQRGTWQGQVTWAEENRSKRFRSALELVRMMDDVMASEAQIELRESKTS